MKTLNKVLSILLVVVIASCGKDEDPTPDQNQNQNQNPGTGEASLTSSNGSCSYGYGGTYSASTALTSSSTVGVEINVTKLGTYSIKTDVVNGYSYQGTGTFTKTGVQNVILTGSGTPLLPGNDTFTVTIGDSNCKFQIEVKDIKDYSSRIILATGQVFMSDNYTFYALDGNKKVLWTKNGFGQLPAVHNGVVYSTTSVGGNMQALNILTGDLIWENSSETSLYSAITYYDSALYISGSDGYIYSLSAKDGSLRWKYFSGSYGVISSSPTVVNDVVYVGGNGGKLFALNVDGTAKWIHQLADASSAVRSSPAVSGDFVYFGNDGGSVFAIKVVDGSEVWSYNNATVTGEQSPTVVDGRVYIQGNKLNCLNALNGTLIWEYVPPIDPDWSSPTVSNGVVYASGLGEGLEAFDAETGTRLWFNSSAGQSADMDPVIYDGQVYIAGAGGISSVNATSGATLWNFGWGDPWVPSSSVTFYTAPVVYDLNTKAVAYPTTSGNVQ